MWNKTGKKRSEINIKEKKHQQRNVAIVMILMERAGIMNQIISMDNVRINEWM